MPFSTIEGLAATLAAGQTTSRALVDQFLDRIAALDPNLGAFARVFAEPARKAAQASDLLRQSGRALSPLHGIPLAVKDLFHYANHPTEGGSKVLAGVTSSMTAHAVQRLEAAGMIVLGKTHTVEFAFGGWGTNHSLGTPHNPWDSHVHRIPGGSSSGSAVAVAAGLAPAGIGSDTGGSVRIPAGLCGLVGLKTSMGLIGRSGVLPLCPTHDTVGPLTRSVRDAALMMTALTGRDPDDPTTHDCPTLDYLGTIERGVTRLRIGYLPLSEMTEVDPAILALFDASLETLRGMGATLVPLNLPHPLAHYMQLAGKLMSAESYRFLADYVDPDNSLVHPSIRERVLRGRSISAADYIRLLEARVVAQREFLHALDGIDALLAPTCPITAIPLSEVDEDQTPLSAYGRFVNFLDLAALSVPMGIANGLPTGLQIIVRRYDDPLALRIGRTLERDAGFSVKAPPELLAVP